MKTELYKKGLCCRDLAQLSGYSLRTVYKIAAGQTASAKERMKIERILGVKIDWPESSEPTETRLKRAA
ncbi:MAG: hypothetical protein DRQ98_11355 [Gammaproteobacteria bacterium]|nr:MAG: hypothetical protein DRQ98_11355 [Gammaproteobacteria bacterium]